VAFAVPYLSCCGGIVKRWRCASYRGISIAWRLNISGGIAYKERNRQRAGEGGLGCLASGILLSTALQYGVING